MRNHIYSLILLVCLFISCKGQTTKQANADIVNATTTTEVGQPKMMRTQGTDYTQIGCGFQDKDGNLWFGTENEGVYRYDGEFFTQFTKKDGLRDNGVSSITEDKVGNVLFRTHKGICKYVGGKFVNIPMTDTLSITSFLEDRSGNTWFGLSNKGIYRYDGTNFSNLLYRYEHPFFGDKFENFIIDIIQDKNGNIWFSSWNGGGVWRYDGKTFKSFLPPLDYYTTNQDNRRNNNIQNPSYPILNNNTFIQSQDYISDDMIFSMTEDKKGDIWFATRNHGACRYDGKTFTTMSDYK